MSPAAFRRRLLDLLRQDDLDFDALLALIEAGDRAGVHLASLLRVARARLDVELSRGVTQHGAPTEATVDEQVAAADALKTLRDTPIE